MIFQDPSPQKDGGVVSRLPVVPPPAESLCVDREVLGHGEDGKGKALDEGGLVLVLELGGAVVAESGNVQQCFDVLSLINYNYEFVARNIGHRINLEVEN